MNLNVIEICGFSSYSAVIDYRRQIHVRFWRLKSIPAL